MSADPSGGILPGTSTMGVPDLPDAARACPLLVVIVNYKTAALTIACLETLQPELDEIPGARVAVVENASGDGETLAQAIAERGWGSWVHLEVVDRNGGFSMGNNRGIQPALESANPPRYILLLNADTEVRYPGAIRTLIDFMDENPKAGLAGSSFENLDGSDWHLAFRFPTPLGEFVQSLRIGPLSRLMHRHIVVRFMDQDRPQPVDWVAGACMIIRREVFGAIGLMDEEYFLYFEEVDFCLQANRAGWPCWYVPQSRIMHIGGQSTKQTERNRRPDRTPAYWFASRSRYFRKNFGLSGAIAADLGYGLGFAVWRLRRFVTRSPDTDPPHHLGDFWKNSVFFKRKTGRG
jgi:N-acetylglucosaminyl-diphospho-decaprenol L-rhamnosyltransferase